MAAAAQRAGRSHVDRDDSSQTTRQLQLTYLVRMYSMNLGLESPSVPRTFLLGSYLESSMRYDDRNHRQRHIGSYRIK